MKFMNRLMGGTALLARTAQQIQADDDADTGSEPAQNGTDPGDENEEQPSTEPKAPVEPEVPAEPAVEPDESAPDEAAAEARGRVEMATRITAVFASEHVVGREAAAAALLAEGLSSDRVISLLAKLSKGGSADMLNSIRKDAKNPDIKPGGEAEPRSAAKSAWGKALKRQGVKTD